MARIIMADDDNLVCDIACRALMSNGHAVGILHDGLSALNIIRSRRPDLVILDCNMPVMNGILVLREIRKSPELIDTLVIVLTARTSYNDVELIFNEGADAYLSKPFDPDELIFRVDTLLDNRFDKRPAEMRETCRRVGFTPTGK